MPRGHPSAREIDVGEQARLDEAVRRADELLVNSLKNEERRRGRRRFWILSLGAVAMITAIIVVALALSGGSAGNTAGASDRDQAAELSKQGWALWQQQKLDEAQAKFEQAVKLDPKNTAAWNGLGWANFNQGQGEAAQQAWEKVIALEPSHPAALNGLGQLALSQRQYDKAEKYLLKAAPQAPAAWYGLARLYLLQGKFDQAQKWAQKIVDSGQADAGAQQMLQAAKDKKLSDELRRLIEPGAAPTTSPVSEDVSRGWKLMNQGRGPEAKEIFEAALKRSPDDPAANNGMGWYLLNTGQSEQAKAYFEKAIAADPQQAAGAMNGLARALKAQGKTDEAIKLWKQMIEQFPGPHAGTAGLAETYLEQGKFDEAMPLYEQLTKAMPGEPRFQAGLEKAQAGAKH